MSYLPMHSSAHRSFAVGRISMGFVTWMYAVGFTEPTVFVFISIGGDRLNDL